MILDVSLDAADLLVTAFSRLGIRTVGIAKADLTQFEVLLAPFTPPIPDRHDLVRSAVLSQGVWN